MFFLKKDRLSQYAVHLIIIVLLFLMVYPLAMALWDSFKNIMIFDNTRFYPTLPLRVTNISSAWANIWRYIFNTLFVAACGTSGSLFISALSAYTFARMKFIGKNVMFMMIISVMMIPGILTLVPTFMLYKGIVGLNNYMILILPTIIGGPIFGTFLLRSFFEGLPESIFESSRIDGATEFKVFTQICLPMSMPIMGTLAIMQIVGAWNDYMWPMITITDDKLLTISAGLFLRFSALTNINYPILFSGYLLSSLPLILLFIFANKYYVEGLSSSAIKL